jgi:hypothetical protein
VSNFSGISLWEQVIFERDDDDDVHFVLGQYQYSVLGFIAITHWKKPVMGRNVT